MISRSTAILTLPRVLGTENLHDVPNLPLKLLVATIHDFVCFPSPGRRHMYRLGSELDPAR